LKIREEEVMEVSEKRSDFFTVNELAKYFDVNPKTIHRRLWAKAIPAFKVGKTWRIAKKDIICLKR
jgi:excisionase family DNA binding protein